MRTQYILLSLLASALAFPHKDNITHTGAQVAKTVVITVTNTIHRPSTFDTTSVALTDSTLTCPVSTEPCVIDSVVIWPSGTTSSVPLASRKSAPKTTYSSAMSLNRSVTLRAGTNAASIKCSHSMSRVVSSAPPTHNKPMASKKEYSIMSMSEVSNEDYDDDKAEEIKTSFIDPIAWAGADNALMGREEKNNTYAGRKTIWSRFFAVAHSKQIVRDLNEEATKDEDQCSTYARGASLVCINGTHYGYCDEGCAAPRRLRDGTKCVQGRIYGARLYHEERA